MRQVPGSSPGSGGRAVRAYFSTLPSSFRTFPTNPAKVLGLNLLKSDFLNIYIEIWHKIYTKLDNMST